MNPSQTEELYRELKLTLATRLHEDRLASFGKVGAHWKKFSEQYFWDESQQDFRLHDLARFKFTPGQGPLLDLAAGCGQFLFQARAAGFDCYAVEPESWKIAFIADKARITGRTAQIEGRVFRGTGECLPFDDDAFQGLTTYQTLEHVRNPAQVIQEMIRVTAPGGRIWLRCPDYRGTFEGHYKLPWLPLFPRRLAAIYLRLLKRPRRGLDSLQYITTPRLIHWLKEASERLGKPIQVIDEERLEFQDTLIRFGIPNLPGLFALYRIRKQIMLLFRRELDIRLIIRVK